MILERDGTGLGVRLRFAGAGSAVRPSGVGETSGRFNFFLGDDPRGWRTDVPAYREVVYRAVWPGVDVAYRGTPTGLKYDVRLAPGARIDDVLLSYDGVDGLAVDSRGGLGIATAAGVLRDSPPLSYQVVDGRRGTVPSRYVLRGHATYGFEVGGHDPALPLVVDPRFSTLIGPRSRRGPGPRGRRAGFVYVAGETESPEFPATPGAFDPTFNGRDEGWVGKLSPDGSTLLWAAYLGGASPDAVFTLALGRDGSVFVARETESSDFPTTPGAYDTTFNGGLDAFVTKVSTDGTTLANSTFLGGAEALGPSGPGLPPGEIGDHAESIAVDFQGQRVRGRERQLGGLPDDPGAYDETYNGEEDTFAARLNGAGSSLVYSTFLGGSGEDRGQGVALDPDRPVVYVSGNTKSAGFPTTPGAFDTTFNGFTDASLTKLSVDGSHLIYSTYLGGSAAERGLEVAVGRSGEAYGRIRSNLERPVRRLRDQAGCLRRPEAPGRPERPHPDGVSLSHPASARRFSWESCPDRSRSC